MYCLYRQSLKTNVHIHVASWPFQAEGGDTKQFTTACGVMTAMCALKTYRDYASTILTHGDLTRGITRGEGGNTTECTEATVEI